MGEDSTSSAATCPHWAPQGRRPQGTERDPVRVEDRLPLEGHAAGVWLVCNGLAEAEQVAGRGSMDSHLAGVPGQLG